MGGRTSAREQASLELVTESVIEGAFRGRDGGTTFQLSNSEAWRKSTWRCRTLHRCCPQIRVWRIGQGFFLGAEGAGEILPVQRLRRTENQWRWTHRLPSSLRFRTRQLNHSNTAVDRPSVPDHGAHGDFNPTGCPGAESAYPHAWSWACTRHWPRR